MERYLETIKMSHKLRGHITHTGHVVNEDNLVILDTIGLKSGNSCEYDAYGEYGINRKITANGNLKYPR